MLVELENVHKIYNRNMANEVAALTDANLYVKQGEMICLKGPSGSGKTTLLSIIGCIFSPTSGKAMIGGKKISRLPDHFLTLYRRKLIGFVFQKYNLLEHLSVLDNVTLPLLPLGISPKSRAEKASPLLERFGMSHRKHFPISQLSGGELQRTAVVRALINDPPIIVADEPTAHLDEKLSLEVMAILSELKKEGKTIIITSHDPLVTEHIAMERKIELKDGKLVKEDQKTG